MPCPPVDDLLKYLEKKHEHERKNAATKKTVVALSPSAEAAEEAKAATSFTSEQVIVREVSSLTGDRNRLDQAIGECLIGKTPMVLGDVSLYVLLSKIRVHPVISEVTC